MGKKSDTDTDAPSPMVKAAAEKIYRLAQDKNLTIEDLARLAGKPFQTFNNWKKGHTTARIEILEKFAKAVDATVSLRVDGPGEGGLDVEHPEAAMIARMVDEMPAEDRQLWLKRIDEHARWRRATPPEPSAALSAPRGRSKTGSRR